MVAIMVFLEERMIRLCEILKEDRWVDRYVVKLGIRGEGGKNRGLK